MRQALSQRKAEQSLAEFTKQSWHILEPNAELKWGWALDSMCAHLEAVSNGDIIRLLITVPPGLMKSLMTTVFWPAWEWGPQGMAYLRYVATAHKEDIAIRDNVKCKRLITSSWFQSRWPINLMSDQNAKSKFENEFTGIRESTAFTSMTGLRGDRALIDDPISAYDANSKAHLKAAETTFNETLPTRLNSENSAIVVIMQRLHAKDPAGIILEDALGYTHLMLPMEFEPERRCYTVVQPGDPNIQPIRARYYSQQMCWIKEGTKPPTNVKSEILEKQPIQIVYPWDNRAKKDELLFKELFPRTRVDALKRSLKSYGVAGQLQQRPSPRGGGIVKEEWWGWWKVQLIIRYRRMYVDTAQKTKEENDYSVLQVWGMTDEGRIALLDQMRGKWEAPELDRNARQFWNKHRAIDGVGPLEIMKVEDKVSGTGLIQTLKRPNKRGDGTVEPALPVRAVQRDRDKVSRAYSAAPQIEAGNVLLPFNASWIADYISEFNDFPAGAHDDQCDPTFDAIEDMLGGIPVTALTGAPEGALGPSVVG